METHYPSLYRRDTIDFSYSAGFGYIVCEDCIVTEELNGEYTAELTCDKDAAGAGELLPGNILYIRTNPSGQAQPFRIYAISHDYDSIHVQANHLSYDLSGCVARPTEQPSASAAADYLFSEAGGNNGLWLFTITDATGYTGTWKLEEPRSVRGCMLGEEGSLIDRYGGEWIFDNFSATLAMKRGKDRGARVIYGVNMLDYHYEHTANAYSHVIAHATLTTGTEEEPEEEIICGACVPTGVITATKTLILDANKEYSDENPPTTAKLTTYTENYIRSHKAELTGDTVTVTATPEMLDASVQMFLGDTVQIIYPDRVTEARVTRTEFDPLKNKYSAVTLGTPQKNLAQIIKEL